MNRAAIRGVVCGCLFPVWRSDREVALEDRNRRDRSDRTRRPYVRPGVRPHVRGAETFGRRGRNPATADRAARGFARALPDCLRVREGACGARARFGAAARPGS